MRISDWSSDVCSSDLPCGIVFVLIGARFVGFNGAKPFKSDPFEVLGQVSPFHSLISIVGEFPRSHCANVSAVTSTSWGLRRTHSHTVATRQPCSISFFAWLRSFARLRPILASQNSGRVEGGLK